MLRRFLPLAPLAPVVSVLALAAAGAAAQNAVQVENGIEDIQVGETGSLLRIAVICADDCRIAPRAGGAFYLPGVRTSLDIDLSGRAELARGLSLKPAEGGSLLTIDSPADVLRASIKPCEIDASAASCIDLQFGDRQAFAKVENAPRKIAAGSPPADKVAATTAPTKLTAGGSEMAPAPALREAPGEAELVFARFAAPERLTPPADAPLRNNRGVNEPSQVSLQRRVAPPRPAIILKDKAEALIESETDIAGYAAEILHRSFGVAECEGARARLRADAWALDAMVNVGYCDAIAGKMEEADGVFARLLAYTPDNYEALVGRALIAARKGERNAARRYFQDALNALPPIEESDRIVEAMANL